MLWFISLLVVHWGVEGMIHKDKTRDDLMKTYCSLICIAVITTTSAIPSQEITSCKTHSIKEIAMKNYEIIHKPSIMIIGVKCRTSNAPEAGPYDIPKHWEKF
jgi:hypothetical protein